MPNRERVNAFVSYVENRRFMDALCEFYHEETALQENDEPPRLGLAANLEHEAKFLESVAMVHEVCARSVLVDGEWVAIRWTFEVTLKNGARVRRDEIALQRWEDDRIICERFYYNTPAPPRPGMANCGVDPKLGAPDVAVVEVDELGQIKLPLATLESFGLRAGDRLNITATPAGLSLRL